MIERRTSDGSRPISRQRWSSSADLALNVSTSAASRFHSAASRAAMVSVRRQQVPLGSLPGRDRERPPLAPAADQQRPGEHLTDAFDARLEVVEALPPAREGDAERLVLGRVPAGSHAQQQAPARELVHGPRRAAQDGRHVEGHRADHRPELDAVGPLGRQRKRRPGRQRAGAFDPQNRPAVIAGAQRGEAEPVHVAGYPPPAVPRQPLLRLDHHPKLRHG
jgi:hypothetical protein